MANDSFELQTKGFDLGALLMKGEAVKAKKEYDSLINRIQDENKSSPATRDARIEQVHLGMADANPDDVKSPGNGTDTGFYIYWNTENVVSEAINRIGKWCKSHDNCNGIGWEKEMKTPPEAAGVDNKLPDIMTDKGKKDLADMLLETNDWLYKELPDGLERHTFTADFNRRRLRTGLEAVMDDSLSVNIRERVE